MPVKDVTVNVNRGTLGVSIESDSQNVVYREIYENFSRRFKIEIVSNPHKFQCSARVSVLNPELGTFSQIEHIESGAMKTETGLYTTSGGPLPGHFLRDRDELVRRLKVLYS